MSMLPPVHQPPVEKRRRQLLRAFDTLDDATQEQLLDFAEFLAARHGTSPEEQACAEPREIPRPAEETVIAAVRRLSQTYHMLDKAPMLHQTSSLVSAHIMQGRPATEVIDELEQLFESRYRDYRKPDGE
jgi:hypothetical protein